MLITQQLLAVEKKINTLLGCLILLTFLGVGFTKFQYNQILLNKISRKILATTKPVIVFIHFGVKQFWSGKSPKLKI
jgi:hypothetical protein